MTDDILVGTNAGLTVGEAACPDDAVVFGATDAGDEGEPGDGDECANQSLAAVAREADQ